MYDVFLTLSSPYFLRQFLPESRTYLAAPAGWEAPLALGSGWPAAAVDFHVNSEA